MDAYAYVITALLQRRAHNFKMEEVPVPADAEFVPFNLSYLRDFSEEKERSPVGVKARNKSDPLPA